MVHKLFLFYRNDLLRIIKEMRLPYSIEVLTTIRQECYRQCHAQPWNQARIQIFKINVFFSLI